MPDILTKKSLDNQTNFLRFWESFHPEILNQKVCRMILSVHKRCSRLAVLGELGRYPVFLPAIRHSLQYQYSIDRMDRSSLVYKTISEMKNFPAIDSWYNKVEKIKELLNITRIRCKPQKVGIFVDKIIQSKFDRFYLDEINQIKVGADGLDHNKLRLYKTLKGSFCQESYVTNITN